MRKLPPRMKKVDAPPVLLHTWIVRRYEGELLVGVFAKPTQADAKAFAEEWRQAGEDHFATVEAVCQERKRQ